MIVLLDRMLDADTDEPDTGGDVNVPRNVLEAPVDKDPDPEPAIVLSVEDSVDTASKLDNDTPELAGSAP